MRICAGKLRGRQIKIGKEHDFRPTTERVREAIFSTLSSMMDLNDSTKVLDLYAGSGSLGIEALSRGAGQALFIEKDKKAAQALKENLLALGLKAEVRCAEVLKAIPGIKEQFSLILIDPPYADHPGLDLLKLIVENDLLEKDGIMVVESSKYLKMPEFAALSLVKEKHYGDTVVRYYAGENLYAK